MRPVTKVLLVLAVVALAVGVVWFVSQRWAGKPESVATKTPTVKPAEPPSYNDPLAAYQRWRDRFAGQGADNQPSADRRGRGAADVHSSSQHEGTAVARRSEAPVAGADPPGPTGPTLRPSGIAGDVVTGAWKPRTTASGGNAYTIAQGDTLYGIAMKHYGDARCAQIIETANPGLNPTALRVGEKILLPEKPAAAEKLPAPSSSVAAASSASGAAAAAPAAGKVYVVQKSDTLIGISKRVYGDASMYRKIYDANKDVLSSPSATLHVGQKLRLPEK
jgi:nucleoid-associated protein YgaU